MRFSVALVFLCIALDFIGASITHGYQNMYFYYCYLLDHGVHGDQRQIAPGLHNTGNPHAPVGLYEFMKFILADKYSYLILTEDVDRTTSPNVDEQATLVELLIKPGKLVPGRTTTTLVESNNFYEAIKKIDIRIKAVVKDPGFPRTPENLRRFEAAKTAVNKVVELRSPRDETETTQGFDTWYFNQDEEIKEKCEPEWVNRRNPDGQIVTYLDIKETKWGGKEGVNNPEVQEKVKNEVLKDFKTGFMPARVHIRVLETFKKARDWMEAL